MPSKRSDPSVLRERKARSGRMRVRDSDGEDQTVLVQLNDPTESDCPVCFARPKEPCVSMKSGRPLKYSHAKRTQFGRVPRFEAGTKKLTRAGVALERSRAIFPDRVSPQDVFRYDPPQDRLIGEDGAYVTFVGSPHGVAGAFQKLRPGHTYFAKHAPNTTKGYDKHGQFLVHFQTEHGPVWLMPYEYVVFEPLHLWHLVREKLLKFTAKGLSEGDFGWQVFYCQTRGIPLEQAVIMCLGSINRDVGWFEPTEDREGMWWKLQSIGLTPMQKEAMLAALEMEA